MNTDLLMPDNSIVMSNFTCTASIPCKNYFITVAGHLDGNVSRWDSMEYQGTIAKYDGIVTCLLWIQAYGICIRTSEGFIYI